MVNRNGPKGFALLAIPRPDLFDRMFGEIKDLESQLKEISPIQFVSKDSPPLLLIHGDADKTVPPTFLLILLSSQKYSPTCSSQNHGQASRYIEFSCPGFWGFRFGVSMVVRMLGGCEVAPSRR